MSTTIDQRVVEMRFDNKHFENNVSTTMSTLEKFKQALKLDGATKGLETVSTTAKRMDLSGLTTAAETVGLKFNAMYTMADQALRNIVNSAMSAGKRIVSALTIDPIKTGLQEYETQINAVQTILANTESKGTTLEDVNGALDTLNEYADKTIYNFTEMTRNIGTFTAAGVDLDTSVNAIQGIANLAAVSGSTSQQASTAMYQLSQAMASGTVKLMDWNSVVNAGMGGQVFQDALKETARVHGVAIDSMIEENGSFRETLQEGWLTTDILTETLSHFTMAAEEGSEQWKEYKKTLMDSGYSEDQANAILKMSNTATDAATKVKTATQLFDTLKETAQSGWTQTWEIIFGDFEEAKNLFSTLYETLAPILEASAKARNELLKGWADLGGRNDLIESLYNIFDAIGSIVKPIKEAFSEIFPPATAEQLFNITKAIKEFTAKLTLGKTASDNLKRTFKGLFAIIDIVKQTFGAIFKVISPLFGKVDDLGGGILGITAKWGDWLVKLNESIKASGFFETAVEKIRSALEKISKFFKPVIEGLKKFGNEITKNLTAASTNAQERLGPLVALGNFIKNVFVAIGKAVAKVFPYISAAATGIGNVLSDLMGRITDSIQNANYDSLFDLASGGILTAIGVYIAKFFKSGSGILDGASGFVENLNGILEGAGDALGAFTDSLKADTLKKIATAIAILAASLLVLSLIDSEKLTLSLVAVTVLFQELMWSMEAFGKLGDTKGLAKTAGAIVALSAAVLVLSIALKIMSTMSWSEMGVGLISLTVGLGVLIEAVNLLPESKVNGAAKAIKKLSSAILILAIGIKIMSTMSWEEMGIGLISMVVGLAALVGAVNLLPKDTALRAAGMIGLATAMVILSAALKIMATMSWDEVARSLVALAGSLAILAGAMAIMKTAIPGALAMMIIAPALVILASALTLMSNMSWEGVAKGLVALGGSLLIIAGAMALMQSALPGAAALLVVAASLAILTPALMALGSMSLAEIGNSLLMLAGVFTVFGLAALILQPLVGTMVALSGSLALFGVACAAIGAGVLMCGVGLTILAAALSASGGAITIFVASIISLIPYLIEQIGVAIIKLCEIIAGSADAICKAVAVIIVAVIDALVAAVPPLVEGVLVLLVSLLESLVAHLPTIATLLIDLLIGLLDVVADNLPRIMESVFGFLVAVIDALAANITVLVEPLLNLFGVIFQGIADVIGPIIETVIAPLLGILSDLIVGLVEAIAPYIPNIQAMLQSICNAFVYLLSQIVPIIQSITALIRQLGNTISQILNSIANVIMSVAAVITVTLQGLANVFSTIFNGIATVITSVGDSIRNVLDGIANTIETIGSAIKDSLDGLANTFDSVFNGIATVIDSVGSSIKNVLDGIAGVIESIGQAALDAGTGFENLAKGVKIITDLSLTDMVASLAAVAAGIGGIATHSSGISSVGDGMSKLASSASVAANGFKGVSSGMDAIVSRLASVKSALNSVVTAFDNARPKMTKIGNDLLNNVISGVESQSKKLGTASKSAIQQFVDAIKKQNTPSKNACIALVSTCATAISESSSKFKSAGKDLGSGLVLGINAKQTAVYNAAYALGQKAVQGEKDGQQSKSPSKATIKAGGWLGEGLVIGIKRMGDKVYNAGSNLGQTATKTISAAISKISNTIYDDIDVQPTIRPILDLSDVRAGAGALNGMLSMDSAVAVRANIGAISSMMSSRGQNGVNSEVVSAIDKLRKDLGKVGGNTYSINGINVSEGTDAADAIHTLVRVIKMEERS